MEIEHRIAISARPERIFGIYEDVANWHTWDPDTKSAVLDGPFRAGSRGTLTPSKGKTVPMVLTEVSANRSFTAESKIPMFCMVFEHELRPAGTTTEVVHRVKFSGLLTALLGRVLARQLNSGLPRTLANLKQLAESPARKPVKKPLRH